MYIIPIENCKTWKTDKPKIKFSGRSASCCVCMYAQTKAFFLSIIKSKPLSSEKHEAKKHLSVSYRC